MSSGPYHWCLVPECKNTSVKTPQKLWIQVPSDIKLRNTWLKLARRDPKSLSTKTRLYFCEDHFDLENDMENYTWYKLMGTVKRIRMKPNCVPSRFDCQVDRKYKLTPSEPRPAFKKRQRFSTIMEIEETMKNEEYDISLPSYSQGPQVNLSNVRKIDKIGSGLKRPIPQYKLQIEKLPSDDAMDSAFDKCKLSLKSPITPANIVHNDDMEDSSFNIGVEENIIEIKEEVVDIGSRKNSTNITPDVVRCIDNYTEDDLVSHKVKLEELQLKQRLMEEQNKKRKEMLARALADRTKQTEEEVQKLEKIKKELQVLDGQFSQDVAVLRKKIDQACVTYSEAEKHYLRVEKEFLQAKINLQKEKEKKELLTEHLCALITHNETRKAQKLETLMYELASDKKNAMKITATPIDETPVIIDGVDEKSGKIVEIVSNS